MTFLLIILALCVCGLVVWIVMKMSELDERQENLDKYSVYLDERANRLAINEESAYGLIDTYNKMFLDFQRKDIYTATYTETEADTMKYTTDALMEAHARKHLAQTIASDIGKQFKMVEDRTEEGRRRFTYKFKIVEQ